MKNTSRRHLCLTVLVAALLTSGCATLPSPEAMQRSVADFQLPKLPEAGKAVVYVVRPSSMGAIVRFNVFFGDKEAASEMGWTRGSQYIHFNVPPGEHRLFSKAENWAEIAITARAGDVIFVEQDPAFGVLMSRNNLLALSETVGKYHVKSLSLGNVIKTDR